MDGRGVPLSLVVTGANRHDVTQVVAVLDRILGNRPETGPGHPDQNLCADKGYFGIPAWDAMVSRGYVPHVVPRGQEQDNKKNVPGYKARRWVVEAAHSWFNRFRKILVRFEKTAASYQALLHLAAAIICFRKIGVIYG